MTVPRPEHPRPQFVRPDWFSLNGDWSFGEDPGDDAAERGWRSGELPERIRVPFCRESSLSGLGRSSRCAAVWYARDLELPVTWSGHRVLLHFGAADYETTVWLDGVELTTHVGGHSSWSVELPRAAAGRSRLVLRCRDYWWTRQPRGKQTRGSRNTGCLYTPTTGIWQSVWLEAVPDTHLLRPRLTPDLEAGALQVEATVAGGAEGLELATAISVAGREVSAKTTPLDPGGRCRQWLEISAEDLRPWSPADPFLYDLTFELRRGTEVVDRATSYAGLRSVAIRGDRLLLNGAPIFQRLVLDQGYYPDGILTAPDDEALIGDIEMAQAAGFDGARLHQKVFEERFLYHCDRLGYLVWGEFSDWCNGAPQHLTDGRTFTTAFVAEWLEVLERDRNHPAIIGWCPLNETHAERDDDTWPDVRNIQLAMCAATRAADPDRPVIDSSGWNHLCRPATDLYDVHDYEQDPESFGARWRDVPGLIGEHPKQFSAALDLAVPYAGQPFFVSEFGGTRLARADEPGWGYGDDAADVEAFYARFAGLTGALLDNPHICGYCYTQLTDVFQEENGIYAFDRSARFDADRLREIQQRPAACEDEG